MTLISFSRNSVLYFQILYSSENKLSKLPRRHDPAEMFGESATKDIERHLHEAMDTFGSYGEIAKCVR